MIKQKVGNILREIRQVLEHLEQSQVDSLLQKILHAKTVVVIGAGRVGMAARGFAMRLGHLGKPAYFLGDTSLPAIGEEDLLLVASGSGETQTIFDLTEIAKQRKVPIALITGNRDSRMGQLADVIVEIQAPSKTKSVEGLSSIQPMTTLNEQCLGIFFDAAVLLLMEQMGETHESMWQRHSNLE